ncbi:single-stranded DNA-binding protein [Jonesia quinghaiensis]|uniref:single-stranded DNA-binding protein n=1 Tax=Jonesia quinghaiensis TaxID=262806 RepID=UPI000414A12A|nr:single-stranded DNA-binding protein [Jonesia quinghaiensis]
MSNDARVTVSGWIGSQPRLFPATDDGVAYVNFRLAVTKSRYNKAKDEWTEGPTTWFTVKAWRSLAENTAASLRKGDPVIVTGALSTEVWAGTEGQRESLVIEADSLGPNLSRGQCVFTAVKAGQGAPATVNSGADAGNESRDNEPDGLHDELTSRLGEENDDLVTRQLTTV